MRGERAARADVASAISFTLSFLGLFFISNGVAELLRGPRGRPRGRDISPLIIYLEGGGGQGGWEAAEGNK